MKSYSVKIRTRRDGLVVARMPALSRVAGYGLDIDEALYELCKKLRAAAAKRRGLQFQPSIAGTMHLI